MIDDFKEEICAALEDYSRQIDLLKREMDESSETAAHIKTDIAALDHRYAIVEPGERCYICQYPLLSRQFFVFPCQHAFHSDCLGRVIVEHAGVGKGRRIKELQVEVSRGITTGSKRERAIKELDSLVAASWYVGAPSLHRRPQLTVTVFVGAVSSAVNLPSSRLTNHLFYRRTSRTNGYCSMHRRGFDLPPFIRPDGSSSSKESGRLSMWKEKVGKEFL